LFRTRSTVEPIEQEVGGYFKAGKLKHKETVVQRIDNAGGAFIGPFSRAKHRQDGGRTD